MLPFNVMFNVHDVNVGINWTEEEVFLFSCNFNVRADSYAVQAGGC